MNNVRSLILLLLLLITPNCTKGQLPGTGLSFYSHKMNVDKRTSLILNDGNSYKLKGRDVFTLEFDMYLRDELVKFGDVFRIISNTEVNFDLVINNDLDRFLTISRYSNTNGYSQTCRFENPDENKDGIVNSWNTVKIVFDKANNRIDFMFNNDTAYCNYDLSDVKSLLIYFGVCDYLEGYSMPDVSPVILKNIVVSVNNKVLNSWTMDGHAGNLVYDDINGVPAIVSNPLWMKDNRFYWRTQANFRMNNYPQIAFDSISNNIYVFNDREYVTYSLASDSYTKEKISNPISLNRYNNQIVFDYNNRRVLAYNILPAATNSFNFATNSWASDRYVDDEDHDQSHAQHNRFFNQADTSLMLFGGYGFYQFKNDFFRLDLRDDTWSSRNLEGINPRYLAATGDNEDGSKLYLFGGRGAEQGLHELSAKNYSDLYEIDPVTAESRLIYNFSEGSLNKDYVYSNNLFVNSEDSCFYLLAYPNNKFSSHIVLKKISLTEPVEHTLGDTIDFYFRDVTSLCDLYYSPSLSKLIAVAAYRIDDVNDYSVNIYTLNYPPLQFDDIVQRKKSMSNRYVALSVLLLALIAAVVFRMVRRKSKHDKKVSSVMYLPEENKSSQNSVEILEFAKIFYPKNVQGVCFFGGFQVFNSRGENITKDFTPTLKHIFVLISLYTLKNEKGISSTMLQELLWFDKAEEAARNNRNVNLRKLRLLLKDIGDIDISNKEGYWKIVFGNIFFDVMEVMRLTNDIKISDGENIEDVCRLLEIASNGLLLPNIQQEWMDGFKTDFSNSIVDILIELLHKQQYNATSALRLKIADVILIYDTISEEAIRAKCEVFFALGKKGSAKAAFDNFVKEYNLLLGEVYPYSLSDIINAKKQLGKKH